MPRFGAVLKTAAALVLTAALFACEGSEEMAEPPADAIQVGEDRYMVPVGTDEDGCVQYTAWSSSRPSDRAIHFRKADESFTRDKAEAACGEG